MARDLTIGRGSPLKRLTTFRLSSSLVLILTALLVIILANSPIKDTYFAILDLPIKLQVGHFDLFQVHGEDMTLAQFANDVLMVLFFLHVGLSIKEEMLVGELSSIKKALFPVVAALGGITFPVLIYLMVCHKEPGIHGMAIPMATDIAFSLAVLTSIRGVPTQLKTFVASLAVADDIAGILVIAIFYSSGLDFLMLGIAIIILAILYFLGRFGVRDLWIYGLGLLFVWYFFLRSGIHTTISGVLVAMMIPAKSTYNTRQMVDLLRSRLALFPESSQRCSRSGATLLPSSQIEVAQNMMHITSRSVSPVQRMEANLEKLVNYFVLPLFAFVNAGLTFSGIHANEILGIPLAIFLGLVVGKTLGIFLFSRLYLWLTKQGLPNWLHSNELFGAALVCGIGFTVSLFLATLTFEDAPELLNQAKLGIFFGSLFSGCVGYAYLSWHYKKIARKRTAHKA